MSFQPWIRKINYSRDYFEFAYKTYIGQHEASYPCNYYSVDHKNSIYEDENLLAGSYEKWGVGELSGYRWKKIYMLPLMTFEQIQPQLESSEEGGMTYRQSITANTSFPDIYNFKPTPGDIIDPNFAIVNEAIDIKPLLVVTNINLAHIGDFNNLFQLSLRVAPFRKDEVEKQISSYFHFYDLTKKILPLNNVSILSKIVNRFITTADELKDNNHEVHANVITNSIEV